MERKLYQLCDRDSSEWALILTEARKSTIQEIWSQVMKEEEEGDNIDFDPIDEFLERIAYNTERIYITEYIRP